LTTEYAMTKTQYQLTIDEGKLWDDLLGSSGGSGNETESMATRNSLALLAKKSSMMSESYQRQSNPASAQTYSESKEILHAMGVPCIDVKAPFEAEALAASLVINGLADYVASEDTVRTPTIPLSITHSLTTSQDVLIYGAPLIRNITNRQSPLHLLSGTHIRHVLQLDRARFVDFALLLGTDFSPRIKNVGPARALKFIREHGSIERVLACETKFPPRVSAETYLEQVQVARGVFGELPPVPDTRLLQIRECDEGDVAGILQRHGLHRAAAYDWEYAAALDGNYFEDNPSAV
jgi:flap endonuclease-1